MAGPQPWELPSSLIPRALSMSYTGSSHRQIYMSLWPENPPVNLITFVKTMTRLLLESENAVNELARREGVPTMRDIAKAEANIDRFADLSLMPAVQDLPLPAGYQEALAHLDMARGGLLQEMARCADPKTMPAAALDKHGNPTNDPQVVRSNAVANLANALSANVGTRLRFLQAQVQRTVTHHNLRLATREQAEESLRNQDRGQSAPEANAPGFIVDLSSDSDKMH